MNIPKTVKIGGITYNIEIKKFGTVGDKADHIGQFSGIEGKIDIADITNTELMESTLLHEIIECICYQNGIPTDHQIITTLEANLYQVFQDNPKLFKSESRKAKVQDIHK